MSPGTTKASAANTGGDPTFNALRALLTPHAKLLQVTHDTPTHYYANAAKPDSKGKAQFFGAVKTSGRKQLFHFMPIYDFPDLLDGLSPSLKKRMQGKSCFNFDTHDVALLDELRSLVKNGVQRYQQAKKL